SMSITYPETYIALADQVYAEGDTTKAIDLLLTAKEKFPYYFRTPLKLKELYLKTGRVEQVEGLLAEAIDRLEYKVEKYPEEKFWWMFLGPLYMENNQTEDAIWAFENALEIDPDERMALSNLLRAYRITGENEKAIKLLERWKEDYRNDKEVQQLYSYFRKMFR
ncbi:MAG: tetratricopeptide repeat protein, partial [candidate division Zixibacteria bacterium]|nr:tetratricopeptide repeat protein [candidate division Zixibacteria bacterium]